ncbi:hypothetical protein [Methylobacter tundripaludum]|uniref:hypothetical protein n=1 Tax=Methylobacter tundripaludum TaxID=173365 RepID=UPI000488BE1F|nr:hypothetical protein [Methylobacter tundripaludum]
MQLNKYVPIIICLASLLSVLSLETAQACKDRYYPQSFPLDELKEYNHVYVVRVDTVNLNRPLEESWYAPPFSFEGKIIKSLKGPKKPGDIIQAGTNSNEEAHARCPIFLETGKVYLLMFTGNEIPYSLPRYGSLYISSDQPEFRRYIANISRANKNKRKK